MPKGKGTYGDQVGRPSKKGKKYFTGGMTNNRKPNPNLPITPPNQMEGKPRPDEPLGPPDETSMYDMYGQFIMPYNQEYMDKKDGGKIEEYKEGGEIPTFDARNRNESVKGFMEGGGTPQATNQYAEGGQVDGEQPDSYFLGGALKKAAKRLKKAVTRHSQWKEWKPFRQRGLGLGKLVAGAGQAITNTDDPLYDKLAGFEGESLSSFADDYTSEPQEPEVPTPGHLKEAGFGFEEGGEIGDGADYYPRPKNNEFKPVKTQQYKEGGKVGMVKHTSKVIEPSDEFIAKVAKKVAAYKSSQKALPKGKGLKKGKGLTSTKGKAKKIRKPEAGENKFTGKKYHQATKFFNDGLTKAEAKEKASKNVFRRKK